MKKIKKLSILLLVLIISCSNVSVQADAAKKVTLNKSRLTLYVGKSSTLKVKNTAKSVKWSSSNKSVVTVTNRGRVSAKKTGTARIIAKVSSKKLVCKVTVKKKSYSKSKGVTYVYITNTGSKYHTSGCRYLWNSKIKITKAEAKKEGYDACSVCNP